MTASTETAASVRAALSALIDYAGLFLPAQLTPAQALREYGVARQGPHAWMLGRYIVPLGGVTQARQSAFPLSVIVPPDAASFEETAALRRAGAAIEALEVPLGASISPLRLQLSAAEILDVTGAIEADITTAGLRDLPVYLEIPNASPWRERLTDTMDALARLGLSAKIRCGGLSADAYPSVEELARFIQAAGRATVSFKATAGLHHPVRGRDPASGVAMHGFLNVLAAAAFAGRVDGATLVRIVGEEEPQAFSFDADGFAWRNERATIQELSHVRTKRFAGYGSCSFDEPVDDLTALHMLPTR